MRPSIADHLPFVGFNSFTQQLCIDNAVVRDPDIKKLNELAVEEKQVPQSVTYKTSVIDKVTDVTNAMNVCNLFHSVKSS